MGGQGSGAGWQTVNASADIPAEAVASFSRFQNGNVYPPVFDPEDAAEQIVSELQTDGAFSFLTHIKYGLTDETGRPAMFAHSYVFPLNDFIRSPQDALNVESSDFAFDSNQTAVPKSVLSKTPKISLSDAFNGLGITSEIYALLVQCIYFAFEGKAKNALHIICDCQPETIRKILVCIYSAIPYEFRKKITYSTYESQNSAPKVILFDRQLSDSGSYYFRLSNGENNVLSDAVLKRWEKYEFMKKAPGDTDADIDGYFAALEEKLALFGSAQTTSLELYKIAHDLWLADKDGLDSEPATPESLCIRLNEFLSAPVSHPYIDRQIDIVLGKIIDDDVELNDILSEKLCGKLEKTQDRDLIETGYMFNSAKISRMAVEEGGKYLFNAYKDRSSESFIQIKKLLDGDAKGRAILSHFYNNLIAAALPPGKEQIIAFHAETLTLSDRSAIQESLHRLINAYLKSIVNTRVSPSSIMYEAGDFLRNILGDRPDMVEASKNQAKKLYWNLFSYDQVRIDDSGYYAEIFLQSELKSDMVHELLQLYRSFISKNLTTAVFNKQLLTLFGRESRFSSDENALLFKKFQDACILDIGVYDAKEIDIWIIVSGFALGKDSVRFMIENNIPGMVSDFATSFKSSSILKVEKTRQMFSDALNKYIQEKPEGYKIAAEALHVIKEQEKTIKQEQKNQEKEQKRQETAGEDGGKKPFFGLGNIIPGLKKKPQDEQQDLSNSNNQTNQNSQNNQNIQNSQNSQQQFSYDEHLRRMNQKNEEAQKETQKNKDDGGKKSFFGFGKKKDKDDQDPGKF